MNGLLANSTCNVTVQLSSGGNDLTPFASFNVAAMVAQLVAFVIGWRKYRTAKKAQQVAHMTNMTVSLVMTVVVWLNLVVTLFRIGGCRSCPPTKDTIDESQNVATTTQFGVDYLLSISLFSLLVNDICLFQGYFGLWTAYCQLIGREMEGAWHHPIVVQFLLPLITSAVSSSYPQGGGPVREDTIGTGCIQSSWDDQLYTSAVIATFGLAISVIMVASVIKCGCQQYACFWVICCFGNPFFLLGVTASALAVLAIVLMAMMLSNASFAPYVLDVSFAFWNPSGNILVTVRFSLLLHRLLLYTSRPCCTRLLGQRPTTVTPTAVKEYQITTETAEQTV